MYDLEKIISLTAEDVAIISKLRDIAEEAKHDAELIAKVYRFKIGEEKIEVWNDQRGNIECLTHSGDWQARYSNLECNLKVDINKIFEIYRNEWLIKNGYELGEENSIISPQYDQTKCITKAECFRAFVKRTEESLKATTNN